MEKLEALEPDYPYEFYYGQKIFDILIDLTADLFVDKRDSNDTLWKQIYYSYKEQRCVMYQVADRILGGPSIEDALWQIAYRKQNSIIDSGVRYNIQMFLDYLAGNTITHRLTADIGTDCWEYWVRDDTVNRVYSQLVSGYREAFSDNMACCTMQCSIEEYIFSYK